MFNIILFGGGHFKTGTPAVRTLGELIDKHRKRIRVSISIPIALLFTQPMVI